MKTEWDSEKSEDDQLSVKVMISIASFLEKISLILGFRALTLRAHLNKRSNKMTVYRQDYEDLCHDADIAQRMHSNYYMAYHRMSDKYSSKEIERKVVDKRLRLMRQLNRPKEFTNCVIRKKQALAELTTRTGELKYEKLCSVLD